MTHAATIKLESQIDWADCEVIRYENNNGVVLKHKNYGVIFFLSGADIGVNRNNPDGIAIGRALPIFNTMITIHNRATVLSEKRGYYQAQNDIKRALGI